MRFKHTYVAFFVGVIITLATILAVGSIMRSVAHNQALQDLEQNPSSTGFVLDTMSGLFRSPLATITADDTTTGTAGLVLSPSGRYLVFGTEHGPSIDNPNSHNRSYVADLMMGTKKELLGDVVWPWTDDNILVTTEEKLVHVFDMHSADSPLESFPVVSRAIAATPSPDKTTLAITTKEGIILANRPSGTQSTLSTRPNTAATAWFSDGERILGYRPSGEDGLDAGPLKELAIWDTGTRDSEGVDMRGLPGTIRQISWLIQDSVALVAAGFDDGLFFYSANLTNGEANLLGEASELWYDSVDYGQIIPRFTLLQPSRLTSRSYNQGVVIWTALNQDIYRNNPTLIDYTTAVYRSGPQIARDFPTTNNISLLDLRTGVERTIYRGESPILDMVTAQDTTGTYWIGITANKLITRKIED